MTMKVHGFIILVIIHVIIVKGEQYRTTQIDLVLEGLNEQKWSDEEEPCFKQTIFILNNAKNYTVWAMWIWNSMQHPFGTFYGAPFSLGHYDQCLQAPTKAVNIKTQYCLADFKLTSKKHNWDNRDVMGDAEAFLGTTNFMNRDISKITWAVCLPATCKFGSAAKILKAIYMANPITAAEPIIEVEHCQLAGAKTEFTAGCYAFVILIVGLIAMAALSTIYVRVSNPKLKSTNIAACFCLKHNCSSLIKKVSDDDLATLNFLKVVACIYAILFHLYLFKMQGPVANVLLFDWLMSKRGNDFHVKSVNKNLDLGVDIFFVITGLLMIKSLMTSKKHPLVSLACRYFRLTGSFMLVIFFLATVFIHTGDGPLWHQLAGREQNASSDSWFWSLLMVNNFVNSENITQIVAWHIPCDYHMAIMATAIYMLWKKNYHLGKMATISVTIFAIAMPAIATYWMNFPESIFLEDIHKITDVRKNEVYLETYIKTYHRLVPYLLGMGVGYIMTVYKPQNYRNSLSLKLCIVLTLVATVVGLRTLTATLCTNRFNTAVYASVRRIIYSMVICLWILLLEYGSMYSRLRTITKFNGFTILSRLSYGMYLTHSLFLEQSAFSKKYLQEIGFIYEVTNCIGIVVLTVVASVVLWFLVEAPLNNLMNLVTNSGNTQAKEKYDVTLELMKQDSQDTTKIDKIVNSETYMTKIKAN